jgi:hypothetical protein
MSYQEKNVVVSFLSTILIFAGYCWYVWHAYQAGQINLTTDLHFWGLTILIFIPVSIAARIIILIVFHILNAIATRGAEVDSLTDERDKLIALKASQIGYVVVGIGFLGSMVSLVMNQPPFIMLNIIFCAFNLAQIADELTQLYFYRMGV